jgi:hypothetical protein
MKWVGAALLFCACRHGLSPVRFSAHYQREGDSAPIAPDCAGFSKIVVKDPRSNPERVGDRTREDDPTLYAVSLLGSAAEWAQAGLESQARAASFRLDDERKPTLTVLIDLLDLHERVFSNAEYRARVVLDATVVLEGGRACFSKSFEGDGKNYGRDGSETHYVQTLNRALDAAAVAMFVNDALRDAACGKCAR